MSELNIYQKLIEVRKEVPYLKKEEKGYDFEFVKSSQVIGVLKAKMDSMGLLLISSAKGNKVSDHTTKKGGHNYFTEIEMIYTWVNAEKPEEMIRCPWYGQGLDTGERGVGKAYTYAEKYFLLKFFNIATDKDDPDVFQNKIGSKIPTEPESITDKQIDEITELKIKAAIDTPEKEMKLKNRMQELYKTAAVDRLDTDQAEDLKNNLKATIKFKSKQKAEKEVAIPNA